MRTCFPEESLDSNRRTEHVGGEALVETFVAAHRTLNVDCAVSVRLANLQRTRRFQGHPVFLPNVPASKNAHNDQCIHATLYTKRMYIDKVA